MVRLVFLFIVTVISLFFSCTRTDTHSKELELKEKELELKEKEIELLREKQNTKDINSTTLPARSETSTESNELNQNSKSTKTKYGYVAFYVRIPELFHQDGLLNINTGDRNDPTNIVTWKDQQFTSGINTLYNYTEDDKYRLLENISADFRNTKLEYLANDFKQDLMFKANDNSFGQQHQNTEAYIVTKKIFLFDSYKEASVHKSNFKFTEL